MTWGIILGIVSTILVFFLWIFLHEISHVIAAMLTTGVEWWEIKPYPHKDPYMGNVYGSAMFKRKRQATEYEKGWTFFAPRIANLLAIILLPLSPIISGYVGIIWGIFWIGGLIDLFNGISGVESHSDMCKVESTWGSKWSVFRIIGYILIALSLSITATLWFIL